MPEGRPLQYRHLRCVRSALQAATVAATSTDSLLTTTLDASVSRASRLSICRGRSANVDLNGIRRKISKRLERWSLRNRIVIGAFDISFNLEENEEVGWQLHLYMLVEGEHTPRLEEAVKGAFRPEPTARVPYHFTHVTGAIKPVTYLFKSVFWRRSRYTVFGRRPRTRNMPLKRPELRELLEFLGKYPVACAPDPSWSPARRQAFDHHEQEPEDDQVSVSR